MAEPLSAEEARRRFRAVARGRHPADPQLDVATAKARLREADPGIDISPLLGLAGQRRWKPALLSVLPWAMSPEGRAYLAPLLLAVLDGADRALRVIARSPATTGDSKPDTTGSSDAA